jgi:predicted DNA-binding protein with PD1-like motif
MDYHEMTLMPYKPKRSFIGRLPKGADLFESIAKIANQEGIKIGKVTAIGAVHTAAIAYFNQETKQYERRELDKHLEIVSCSGNISTLKERSMTHCHIVFADENGNCLGGHLTSGCIIFACELIIEEYEGTQLPRNFDEATELNLWDEHTLLI